MLPSTEGRKKSQLTEDEQKRTIQILGKPYHWELNDDGYLSLKPEPSEYDKIRWDVVQMLLDKGMKAEDITREVIEGVIEAATAASITSAVEEVIDASQS